MNSQTELSSYTLSILSSNGSSSNEDDLSPNNSPKLNTSCLTMCLTTSGPPVPTKRSMI